MTVWRNRAFQLIVLLILARLATAAYLPLSADEAYYWLWSQHLAAGYFDHPPAIAFVIRAGTFLFGDTSFGVRVGSLALSVLATWFVWRAAMLLLRDRDTGLLAALFFNATLMVAVETMAATPDAPSMAMAAAFLFFLAKVDASGDGRWWLAAGAAAGLGLLSKYSGLFVGAGAIFWLAANPAQRRWFLSPYPYLGGLIAGLLFLPNIYWNAAHGWETFGFQFGRISSGTLSWRYIPEFLGAQIGLATPFIFVLGVFGLAGARLRALPLAAAMCWPSIAYFLVHALHDRVQGNWPCFLFPAFSILAAGALQTHWTGWRQKFVRISGIAALPLALYVLAAVYLQAYFHVLPLGRNDPMARLLAVGIQGVTQHVAEAQNQNDAVGLLTTDYASTAWFRFYMPAEKVIAFGEDERWPDLFVPANGILSRPLIYVAEDRRDQHDLLAQYFKNIELLGEVPRSMEGADIARYRLYRVDGWRGLPAGRLP